ncbi:hypothetical protein B0H10DRAFT_90920 [Mycena sp. CBHHK59/15]|nr:hypothetical protein B0H10DRAFT_90920 [Mycena sp. CBHHK59/15]
MLHLNSPWCPFARASIYLSSNAASARGSTSSTSVCRASTRPSHRTINTSCGARATVCTLRTVRQPPCLCPASRRACAISRTQSPPLTQHDYDAIAREQYRPRRRTSTFTIARITRVLFFHHLDPTTPFPELYCSTVRRSHARAPQIRRTPSVPGARDAHPLR